jgi:hypothetical protein
MRSGKEADQRSVFLNVPFDQGYEPLFVALISSLVALGRVPRSVLEVPEHGDGRLVRILGLIRSCPVSIHDLSRVGLPVRFNMPFELGIAVALSRIEGRHKFIMLEARRHRLQQTLSDTNGIDPGIHGATVRGIISCVLSHLGKPRGNPDPQTVSRVHRQLWKTAPFFKRAHGRTNIYSRSIFGELVAGANGLARKEGLISD